MRRALITGITGQDGSYLAELLLEKGYEVHGTIRRTSQFNTGRIDHIFGRLSLHHADLLDAGSLRRVLSGSQPDELYHLASQSHVGVSFAEPEYTMQVGAVATLRLLEAAREVCPKARIYNASSSEMFGSSPPPQNEDTPFRPCSPYGVSKLAAHWHAVHYREAYGMFVSNGILFNHESPRRGETFVTRKITRAIGRIFVRKQWALRLGNLDAVRDWGWAPDYVDGMWRMLQHDVPTDFVLATGQSHTVKDFITTAFNAAGMDPERGQIEIDDSYKRPLEVPALHGNAERAYKLLGWRPSLVWSAWIGRMVKADIALAQREAAQ